MNAPLVHELIAGSAESPTIVLLHGFTQNRKCWGPFADRLGERFAVWAVDLPGHGQSGHVDSSFDAACELVARTLRAIGQPVEAVVGYSMGGRMALRIALNNPRLMRKLILVGATAGLDSEDQRNQRLEADRRLAERLRSEGPEQFLDFWLQLDLFGGLTEEQQQREQRLQHWGSGVAETLLFRGTGSMEPLWQRLAELETETLVIVGADDEKFTAIGRRLVAGIGANASLSAIGDTGHACHLQSPEATARELMGWSLRT